MAAIKDDLSAACDMVSDQWKEWCSSEGRTSQAVERLRSLLNMAFDVGHADHATLAAFLVKKKFGLSMSVFRFKADPEEDAAAKAARLRLFKMSRVCYKRRMQSVVRTLNEAFAAGAGSPEVTADQVAELFRQVSGWNADELPEGEAEVDDLAWLC
jgi:hypothetical protein